MRLQRITFRIWPFLMRFVFTRQVFRAAGKNQWAVWYTARLALWGRGDLWRGR